jgi:pyruvate dehydrogenase E1 component alpha subunit
MRMHGHGAHDDMSYVPDEVLEEWSQRDPIELYIQHLAAEHGFEQREIDQIRESVAAYVDECADLAVASPMPDPQLASDGVFAERWESLGDGEAPWSRWSSSEASEIPNGNGRAATNGHAALVEHGRAA